jgi:hypothetical protein
MLLFYEGCHVSCGVHWRQGRKKTQYMSKSVGVKWRYSQNKGARDKGNNTLRKFLKHATLSSLHLIREQGVCHTLALPFTLKSILRKKRIMETQIFHHAKI